jgi:NDP-sugar pyrophosphorylase family protein
LKALLVLAGGFGTRLRPLVSEVPKPLAPVVGKSFLEHLIEHWVLQGVDDFIFLLHYEAKQIEYLLDKLSASNKFSNTTFRSVIESKPLGTGGSILNAIDKFNINKSFMVANADTWLGSGIQELAIMKTPALLAVNVSDVRRYGSLEFSSNMVVSFREKTSIVEQGYVNSGTYNLLPNNFELGSNFSLEEKIFPRLIANNNLKAIKLNETFIDIGIPEDYLKFCKLMEKGQVNGY